MKRILVACISLLLLVGCSSTQKAAPTTGSEAQFLTLMDGIWPGVDHAKWANIGHGICTKLDSGQTPDQVAATMLATGAVNNAGTKVLLRASVVTYCPTHEDVVPAQ
jgi:hypothetical protein